MRLGIFLALLCCTSFANGLYDKNGAVTILTARNFDKHVIKSDVVTVVEFFAPWCGHCQSLAPAYKKVAESLRGIVQVGAIDCDEQKSKPLCGQYGIKGFPTIKVFRPEKRKHGKKESVRKVPLDYTGARAAKALADFVKSKIPTDYITKPKDSNSLQQFIDDNAGRKRALLFTDKKQSTALFKSLAYRFHKNIAFAEVHKSNEEAASEFGVTNFPTLLTIEEDNNYEPYIGELKATALVDFFNEKIADVKKSSTSPEEDEDDFELNVKILESHELNNIDDQEDVWLVGFLMGTEKECIKELKEFSSAIGSTRNMVQIGLFRVAENQMGQMAVYGLNTQQLNSNPCKIQIVRFPFGKEKMEAGEFKLFEGKMEGKAIQDFSLEDLPTLAMELDLQSIEPFLGGTPGGNDPVVPKVLLFTAKEECPPVYKALAVSLRKWKLAFGFVPSADDNTIKERFHIKSLPMLVMAYVDPNTKPDEEGKVPLSLQPFIGPIKFNYMKVWIESIGKMLGSEPEESTQQAPESDTVQQISDHSTFTQKCESTGICVIAFLNPDDSSFTTDLEIFQLVATKHKDGPLAFVWVNANGLSKFLEGFSVSLGEVPTAIGVSVNKMRHAVLRGAWSSEGIDDFLNGVLSGKIGTTPLQDLPVLEKDSDLEGKVEDEVFEEELDLSDIMSEDIEQDALGTKEERLKEIDKEIEEEQSRQEAEKEKEQAAKKKKKTKAKKKQADAKDEL